MRKLYALEEESSSSSNDLLIDRLLEQRQQPKSPLSLTADLLKQRLEVKKEIDKKIETPEEEPSEDSTEEDTDNEKPDFSDDKKEDSEKSSDDSEDELLDSASDPDKLDNLIGSGLSDKKAATESYKPTKKVSLKDIFLPIRQQYFDYKLSLESYGVKPVPAEQQPIAYTKDSVVESINNLIQASNGYLTNNAQFTSSISKSIKTLNERLTVFQALVEEEKYNFTNKLINDRDILANVSIPGNSDLRDTVKVLLAYLEDTNKILLSITNNSFKQMKDAFLNNNFTQEEEEVYSYKKVIPGFNTIQVSIPVYSNYLTTDVQQFHFFKTKVMKTEDLFTLSSISLDKDQDLSYMLTALVSLFSQAATSVDALNDTTVNFKKFVDSLKVVLHDVEANKYSNIQAIGIDKYVQEFIQMKMVIEVLYININVFIEYVTSVFSSVNIAVELSKDV